MLCLIRIGLPLLRIPEGQPVRKIMKETYSHLLRVHFLLHAIDDDVCGDCHHDEYKPDDELLLILIEELFELGRTVFDFAERRRIGWFFGHGREVG